MYKIEYKTFWSLCPNQCISMFKEEEEDVCTKNDIKTHSTNKCKQKSYYYSEIEKKILSFFSFNKTKKKIKAKVQEKKE